MIRRTFTAGALALAVAPFRARAQLPSRRHRVALLTPTRPISDLSLTGWPAWSGLIQELAKAGFVEGRTVDFDRYTALGVSDRDALLRQIVATAPDVIFVGGAAGLASSIVAATQTVPVVFIALDPVRAGLVSNLRRPGANISGFAVDTGREFDTKRLQMLVESVPSAKRIGYLNADYGAELELAGLQESALSLGIGGLVPFVMERPVSPASYREAFARMIAAHLDALFVGFTAENLTYNALIAEFVTAQRLPASGAIRDFADAGGLMAYAVDQTAEYRKAAGYVVRVLNGAKPGELPVQLPSTFEFVVNLKTAKALGITIPEHLMVFATEVIE